MIYTAKRTLVKRFKISKGYKKKGMGRPDGKICGADDEKLDRDGNYCQRRRKAQGVN